MVSRYPGHRLTAVLFQHGRDYVGNPDDALARRTYQDLIDKGWIPMSLDDIRKTSGIKIGALSC